VAAVNCFADGGTNVHLIVQGWDPQPAHQVRRQPIVAANGSPLSTQAAASVVANPTRSDAEERILRTIDFWSIDDSETLTSGGESVSQNDAAGQA
jgi:acyl transferase domain-containing protein